MHTIVQIQKINILFYEFRIDLPKSIFLNYLNHKMSVEEDIVRAKENLKNVLGNRFIEYSF
jgi:hypothetical protein